MEINSSGIHILWYKCYCCLCLSKMHILWVPESWVIWYDDIYMRWLIWAPWFIVPILGVLLQSDIEFFLDWIIIIWWKGYKINNLNIVWIKFWYYQGKSHFYILKNNAVSPVPTGGHHWVEFLPNHVYCFTPSMEINKGEPLMFTAMPEFLKEFLFSVEIKQVKTKN